MKVILSHPTGNANVRAAVGSLRQVDLLAQFHTTIATFPGDMMDRLGSFQALSEIRRRQFDTSLRSVTLTSPWREAARLAADRLGLARLTRHEIGPFCIDAVYKSLDRTVASHLRHASNTEIGAVYAYEDGAALSFRRARQMGVKCFYDLPTGYWRASRRLLEKERQRRPEWSVTLTGFEDSEEKLARKDEELGLAHCIFVASPFTARTLEEYLDPLPPVEVIPYGFPPVCQNRHYRCLSRGHPLKLLFVGRLSQQKGIADLFEAVASMGNSVELTVVGQKATDKCPALNAAIAGYHWIPTLSHEAVLQCMQEHDVLVFPSLFDGFGLVITEAMSQGTPVIASDRSAGPGLIKHGQNGWLVEAGSTNALRAAIEDLLCHPGAIAEAGQAAMETARRRPWEVYGRELIVAIEKHLSKAPEGSVSNVWNGYSG